MARCVRAAARLFSSSALGSPPPPQLQDSLGASAGFVTAGALLRMRRPRRQPMGGVPPPSGEDGCITISEMDTVADAIQLMQSNGVGSVVALTADGGRLAGFLTESTIIRSVLLEKRSVHKTPIAAVMKKSVIGCDASTRLHDVAYLLARHGIRNMPVVTGGQGGHVLQPGTPASSLRGVLSAKDVSWLIFCLIRADLGASRGISALRVSDMTAPVTSVSAPTIPFSISGSALALEAAAQMSFHRRHALCATDDRSALVGLITGRDIVTKIALAPEGERDSALVSDVCTRNPQCASPDWSLEQVLTSLTTYGFRHLPIVPSMRSDEPGIAANAAPLAPHPIGVLAVNDVLSAILRYGSGGGATGSGSFPPSPETIIME